MINFTSMQQAFRHAFGEYSIDTITIPNSPHPWFLVDQIRNAIGFNGDNNHFTRYMDYKDEYLAVLTLPEMAANFDTPNLGASSLRTHGGARRFLLVSLPGLFELLRHISAKTSPRIGDFWYWMNNIVLPTLYYNPQLVEQVHDLSYELDNSRSMCNLYREEAIDLRKRYNNMVRKFNILESITDSTRRDGKLDHDKFIRSMIAYERTNPKIEMVIDLLIIISYLITIVDRGNSILKFIYKEIIQWLILNRYNQR